jgi:hypothetical protein
LFRLSRKLFAGKGKYGAVAVANKNMAVFLLVFIDRGDLISQGENRESPARPGTISSIVAE